MATKKVVKRRRYAEGGKVEPEKPKPKTPEPSPRGIGAQFADLINKRKERMDAVERGEPDPGQKPNTKLACGGKVRK